MLLDDNSKFVSKKQQIPKFIFAHLFHLLILAASGGILLLISSYYLREHWGTLQKAFMAIGILTAILIHRLRIGYEYNWGVSPYLSLFVGIISMVIAGVLLNSMGIKAWEASVEMVYKYYFAGIYYLAYTLILEGILFITNEESD
ncbi:MAG: hypothetical protein MK212_18330 [Saprospiraceae bacterium]|nr:hypothetical protein [Saprospiraceae bacterium]